MLLNVQKIGFRNFFSFGNAYQEVELTEGINIVTGYNKDNGRRNGAGKSCLLDAIVFGLFGRTCKDVTLPRVVNWKNKKQCVVAVDFEKDDVQYKIERGLKPNYVKLFKDGAEVDQVASKNNFQAEIEADILCMDYDTFMSIIYCNPNTNVSIFTSTKQQKRQLIESLFGLETYSKISKKANEKLSGVNTKIQEADETIKLTTRLMEELIGQQELLKGKIERLGDTKIESIKSILSNKNSEYDVYRGVIYVDYSKCIMGFNSTIKRLPRDDAPKAFIGKTVAQMHKFINDYTPKADKLKKDIDEWKMTIRSHEGFFKSLPDVDKLEDGCECPACLGIVDKEIAKKEILKKRKPIEKEVSELTYKIEESNKKLDKLYEILKKTASDIILQQNYIRYAAKTKLETFRNKLIELETFRKKKEELEKEITEWEYKKELAQSIQDQKDLFGTMLNEYIIKKDDYDYEIEITTTKREKLQTMKDYLEYIKLICKDENVKQYAISAIIPFINKQANLYLAEAGFGFYLKIDSFLDVEIKGPGMHDTSYGNMSGGESKSIDLALQLALLDVCKIKSPIFPNILLLDEILDSAVDSVGIEKMMEIIRAKMQKDNLKIFIISHRKEIGEVEHDKMYQIVKSAGYSTVEEI